jgi:antiviral helicase SKI2
MSPISELEESDRQIPQITTIQRLFERDIGIHHNDLVPSIKETVEIPFQQDLIKILFAAESFAVRLNMSTKIVIFHDIFKLDGSERRLISSGIFIHSSGHAGREEKTSSDLLF